MATLHRLCQDNGNCKYPRMHAGHADFGKADPLADPLAGRGYYKTVPPTAAFIRPTAPGVAPPGTGGPTGGTGPTGGGSTGVNSGVDGQGKPPSGNHWQLGVSTNLSMRAAKYGTRAIYGKGATPTLTYLPRQGVIAAELNNVGYDLVEKFGENASVHPDHLSASYQYHTTQATKDFAGELLPGFSDANIQIYQRGDGHLTAITRGTATTKEVKFDAKNIALLDNAADSGLFEQRYYSTLRAVKQEFGKPVDVIMGHSLGGHVAISSTDRGLAKRSVSLNPYVRPSSVGHGDHLILRTPTDPAMLSAANITSGAGSSEAASHFMGHNTRLEVIPETTGRVNSLSPLARVKGRVASHSTYNFQPEHSGLAVEMGDSFAPSATEAIEMEARTSARAALLPKPTSARSRTANVGKTVGKMAKGAGANIVGALATDAALNAVGIENEYVHDVASGVGGAAVESLVLGTAFAEAGPAGLAGGIGVAEMDYLANRTGVTGAGKVAMEVTGGVVNTALAATLATNWWNPLGIIAGAVLAIEGAAVGIDAAVHHSAKHDTP